MARRTPPRELAVWANGLRIGHWRMPGRGSMELEYDPEWLASPIARPLSLSLPIASVSHRGAPVAHYFDNLLPESEAIRRRLQERFRTETREPFDLLAAIGRDCVGAVQLLPPDESPTGLRKIEAQPLTERDIATTLAGITSAARLEEPDEFRISIAGAQEKTALLRHRGRWCHPSGTTPTTHIFKLPIGLVGARQADLRGSVENEWLCAAIVRSFGIPVANCEIGEFTGHKALIVERFDRQLHSSGKYWLRLMQEDFAQATATPWYRKYQSEGGPGLLDIARVLRGSSAAAEDLATLFRAQLAFYLLAAIDGHAKNFSLRLLEGSQYQLTPLYDVISAWPIIGKKANQMPYEKAKLAMAMPGERPHYLLKSIQRRHFDTLAHRLGLGAEGGKIVDEMATSVPRVIDEVEALLPRGFPAGIAEQTFAGMRRHSKLLGA